MRKRGRDGEKKKIGRNKKRNREKWKKQRDRKTGKWRTRE